MFLDWFSNIKFTRKVGKVAKDLSTRIKIVSTNRDCQIDLFVQACSFL